tara:strand:+ start:11572 stop:11814 length:243 start_codon:yes stop_codon:yes gene_type:complete
MGTKVKMKLMSIITERITDFISNDETLLIEKTLRERKLTKDEIDELIENLDISDELGFTVIGEMRKIIKKLIIHGVDEDY